MQNLEIQKYTEIVLRRKYWIIIPLLLSILGGGVYFLEAPKIYEAGTLILVQPQKVPEEYVRPILEGTIEGRLKSISQQVTSRTNLERIIKDFKMNQEPKTSSDLDDAVSEMRKRIRIDVSRGKDTSTFTIAYQDRDPERAMRITNSIASYFIGENLKLREEIAFGRSSFIIDELESVKKRLLEKENELKEYREKHMGGLPEQLQTNLNILERLEKQSENMANRLRDVENRKLLIQTQVSEKAQNEAGRSHAQADQGKEANNLQSLRKELASLEGRYTHDHPDIRRLRETIVSLERYDRVGAVDPDLSVGTAVVAGIDKALRKQLQEIDIEIVKIREETNNVRSQINSYRRKVEDTPKREQELVSLNRDYSKFKEMYNSLLNRKLEAEIAVSMERKQKGEQFRVIDDAKVPTQPIKPNVEKVMLMALVLGLILGGTLAYSAEVMDTSYKDPEEVEKDFKLPILMSIPVRYSVQEVKRHKKMEFFKAACVLGGFVVLAVGIVVTSKGIEKSVELMSNFLGKI